MPAGHALPMPIPVGAANADLHLCARFLMVGGRPPMKMATMKMALDQFDGRADVKSDTTDVVITGTTSSKLEERCADISLEIRLDRWDTQIGACSTLTPPNPRPADLHTLPPPSYL